jgi:hypothetical protein
MYNEQEVMTMTQLSRNRLDLQRRSLGDQRLIYVYLGFKRVPWFGVLFIGLILQCVLDNCRIDSGTVKYKA